MTQNKRKRHDPHIPVIAGIEADTMLNMLLALDRAIVEVSMHIYNLPARDRFAMREQNQRLHDTVRQHLPRLRESSPAAQLH